MNYHLISDRPNCNITIVSPGLVDTICPRRQWGTGQGVCCGYWVRYAVAEGHPPRGSRMSSLKSSCRISYWSLIETIALNCLVLAKTNERPNLHNLHTYLHNLHN